MATNGHIATARNDPSAAVDLEAGQVLNLGEFANHLSLDLSQARIILKATLDKRYKSNVQPPRETETLAKTRLYLDHFAVFKEVPDAEAVEGIIKAYVDGGMPLERFETSQLGSLVPICADEAKAIIPSLEKKCGDGLIDEKVLDSLCADLDRAKRQTVLNARRSPDRDEQ